MIKKTLAVILAAMVVALSGCNNSQPAETTTTKAVAPPSEAWEYEMYIEDLDYFSERYFQSIYAAQSDFSMMNEADAKKHIQSTLDALTSLESVVYPPSLEETHSQLSHPGHTQSKGAVYIKFAQEFKADTTYTISYDILLEV